MALALALNTGFGFGSGFGLPFVRFLFFIFFFGLRVKVKITKIIQKSNVTAAVKENWMEMIGPQSQTSYQNSQHSQHSHHSKQTTKASCLSGKFKWPTGRRCTISTFHLVDRIVLLPQLVSTFATSFASQNEEPGRAN